MRQTKHHFYWYIIPPEAGLDDTGSVIDTFDPNIKVFIKPGLQESFLNLFRIYRTAPSELPEGLLFSDANKPENVLYTVDRIRSEGLDCFLMPIVIFTSEPEKWQGVSRPGVCLYALTEGQPMANMLLDAISEIKKR